MRRLSNAINAKNELQQTRDVTRTESER